METKSENVFLVISEIIGLFDRIMTVWSHNDDNKYSLCKIEKLQQSIQIQISKEEKTTSERFTTFLKSNLNLKYFLKKDDPHSLCISEITECERRG